MIVPEKYLESNDIFSVIVELKRESSVKNFMSTTINVLNTDSDNTICFIKDL